MRTLFTLLTHLTLISPDPVHHALITLKWFEEEYGKETLILIGNAEHEIGIPSLKSEVQILEEFIALSKRDEQLTWMLEIKCKIVGVAWIEFIENHSVHPPSIHLMIDDKKYRRQGLGRVTMQTLIQYIKEHTNLRVIYSRHLKDDIVVAKLNQSIGFINDGAPYRDDNYLEWQNGKSIL